MPSWSYLSPRIADKMDRRLLPLRLPERMIAGFGHNNLCDACDDIIHPAQIEYEMNYPSERSYRLHLGCTSEWERERRRRAL